VREDEDEQVQRMRELGEKIEFLFITMEWMRLQLSNTSEPFIDSSLWHK
jgi:hypothetical protein